MSYSVYCKTNEEIKKVLVKMESEGIVWFACEEDGVCKPTEITWNPKAPYYLNIQDGILTGHNINPFKIPEITAEEYLNEDRKIKEFEIFNSMPHSTPEEVMIVVNKIEAFRKSVL